MSSVWPTPTKSTLVAGDKMSMDWALMVLVAEFRVPYTETRWPEEVWRQCQHQVAGGQGVSRLQRQSYGVSCAVLISHIFLQLLPPGWSRQSTKQHAMVLQAPQVNITFTPGIHAVTHL